MMASFRAAGVAKGRPRRLGLHSTAFHKETRITPHMVKKSNIWTNFLSGHRLDHLKSGGGAPDDQPVPVDQSTIRNAAVGQLYAASRTTAHWSAPTGLSFVTSSVPSVWISNSPGATASHIPRPLHLALSISILIFRCLQYSVWNDLSPTTAG
jgi:hypothetical protein